MKSGWGRPSRRAFCFRKSGRQKKQKLLIIVPAALRKQWHQELADKFFLQSVILEIRTLNDCIKQGNLNPFNQSEIIIGSYHFARAKDLYIKR